ncbi:MAG: hypothetical protein Q9M29_01605 [Mariprofundaceae bacterium]|nr:hypothetical protein [Mariprofundaceae bacterium]
MSRLAGLIRRTGVGQSTLLLVIFIIAASLVLDVLVHRLLNEPMIEPFILADVLIASVIATPICYALLRILVKLDIQREALARASEEIRMLEGLLPVCACCKKIRDDAGLWHQVDTYIQQHTTAEVTHSLCSECSENATAGMPARE